MVWATWKDEDIKQRKQRFNQPQSKYAGSAPVDVTKGKRTGKSENKKNRISGGWVCFVCVVREEEQEEEEKEEEGRKNME